MSGRLPFDPGRLPPRASQQPTDADRPWRVAELAAKVDEALRLGLPAKVRVLGELSGLVERTHWYFNLKDAEAVIGCVMFASAARKVGYTPGNGQEVVVTGRVELYAKSGKLSLIVEKMEPVGAGSLDIAFRKLCEELRQLGWFDPARKRSLPTFPRRIAVVTSRTGAALQDVLNTMQRRCPAVGVVIVDVRVQGDRAAEEIAGAIRAIGGVHDSIGVDAILVTRGGGSKEDLWSFNERIVAETIIKSPVPVVAAIGHETDTTIAELVADERCATPTQAAMRLTPDRVELLRELAANRRRLSASMGRRIGLERERLRSVARHPFYADPAWMMARARAAIRESESRLTIRMKRLLGIHAQKMASLAIRFERAQPAARLSIAEARFSHASGRLPRAMLAALRDARQTLDGAERQLQSVGPLSVLARGYSWTVRADGSILKSVQGVEPGEPLRTRLADGEVASVVSGGTHTPLRAGYSPPKRGRRTKPGASDGPSLFGSS